MSDADRIKKLELRVKQLEAALKISAGPFIRECDVTISEVCTEREFLYPGGPYCPAPHSHVTVLCAWGSLKIPVHRTEGEQFLRCPLATGTLRLEFK